MTPKQIEQSLNTADQADKKSMFIYLVTNENVAHQVSKVFQDCADTIRKLVSENGKLLKGVSNASWNQSTEDW